jgi:hypothetical protein
MAEAMTRRTRALLALSGALAGICMLLFAGPAPQADAFTTTVFCDGQWVGGYQQCHGAQRNMYADFGWGDQHGVCLFADFNNGYPYPQSCSGGPGEGVYFAMGYTEVKWPVIENRAGGANFVHGRAYSP